MSFYWLDIIITFCYLYYGYKFLKNTPEYEDKQGISIKQTKKSPAHWAYGHKIAGIYCIVSGLICAVFALIQYIAFKDGVPKIFSFVIIITEVLLVALLTPVVNYFVKRKMDK